MSATPDLDLGRRFLLQNPPPGRVLLCAVTGSHQYGFASEDSDLDLKGIHLAPTEELLGLKTPPEGFDRLEVFEGVECDLTTNEVRQALSLLLRGNGNMLERIVSPFQLYETPELLELRELARKTLSRVYFGHYAGFFRGICREHEKSDAPSAKSLLYAYRVALCGIHLLQTGQLVANLEELAALHPFPGVKELIEFKKTARERAIVSQEEDARHRATWPGLLAALEKARDESPLPPEPQGREEVEAWLIALRKREMAN